MIKQFINYTHNNAPQPTPKNGAAGLNRYTNDKSE
jgi:hypothetical protein